MAAWVEGTALQEERVLLDRELAEWLHTSTV